MKPHPSLDLRPSWGSRLDGIEGLRGVAAMSVMAAHTILLLGAPSGATSIQSSAAALLLPHGLTLFFVLSGFLLYRPFVSGVLQDRPIPRARTFLRNRVLRIWPAYLVILAVAGLGFGVAIVKPTWTADMTVGRLTDPWLLFTNVFLVQGWFPSSFGTGLRISWSLVPEVSFYLLLPLFGACAVRLARRFGRLGAVILPAFLLLMVGTLGRLLAMHLVGIEAAREPGAVSSTPSWTSVFFSSIFAQGDLFAYGMLAAVAVAGVGRGNARRARSVAWLLAGVACLGAAVLSTKHTTAFMGLLFAAAIAILLLPEPRRLPRAATRLLESRLMRAAGLCSYSVYLWHFCVIVFLRQNLDALRYSSLAELIPCFAVVAAVTYSLSAITYRWVEVPALRRKQPTDQLHSAS